MSNPYARRPLRLTNADRDEWSRYEAANRAAAKQYQLLPISYHQCGPAEPCVTCQRPTKAIGQVCKRCRLEENTTTPTKETRP